ncbi:hypothetical protein E4191_20655 (plasmid) [Paracoccus liaowanqingii]|uniref:Uncharacterized protein n=1 Tax=Paracoccus liaowanqingii TaxID=2560053 RepID=A0A4Y5ST53_9RHOB|nr:hypothetical protein [Paracoccus liaowanqingii]QDA36509.1 hypothetical protein E4191_20655 [Paracoccus liaowanqingii]
MPRVQQLRGVFASLIQSAHRESARAAYDRVQQALIDAAAIENVTSQSAVEGLPHDRPFRQHRDRKNVLLFRRPN